MNGPKNGAVRLLDRFRKPEAKKGPAMPKVAICIPSGDTVHKGFSMCLAALTYMCGEHPEIDGRPRLPGIPLALIGTEGSLIVRNRNASIDHARTLGVDYVLFLDSDMQFPNWTLRRLLSHGKDIVGGTYLQREEPHNMLGLWPDGTVLSSDRIHSVTAIPGGCVLIKLSVFDKMVKPYYRTPAFEADADGEARIQGEDYYFCEQAAKAGYEIWLDPVLTLELGHIGRQVVRMNVQPQMKLEPAVQLDENGQEVPDGQATAIH